MLTFFIAIVLIAEIVITFHIISFILKIDKKVCELNEQIVALTPTIEDTLTSARISLNKVLLALNKFEQKLQSKTEEFKFNILKSVITTALYLLLNTSGKKVLSTIELAFSLKDVMDKWAKKLA
ncbi:hypothetical protein IJ674_00440 [bacterium]|nr:hypothetical protein [bacterium]